MAEIATKKHQLIIEYKKAPSFQLMVKIADALGVSLDIFR